MQRRFSLSVGGVDVSVAVNEPDASVDGPVESSFVEGGIPLRVLVVDLGSFFDHQLQDIKEEIKRIITNAGEIVKGDRAGAGLFHGISSMVQEETTDLESLGVGSTVERSPAAVIVQVDINDFLSHQAFHSFNVALVTSRVQSVFVWDLGFAVHLAVVAVHKDLVWSD